MNRRWWFILLIAVFVWAGIPTLGWTTEETSTTTTSTTSSTATSTAPQNTKDQLGLTFVPILGVGASDMVTVTFFLDAPTSGGMLPPSIVSGGATVGGDMTAPPAVFPSQTSNADAQNAGTPSTDGGIWGLPSGVTVH